MAMALGGVAADQEQVAQAAAHLDALTHREPHSEGLVISEVELKEAVAFETEKEAATQSLKRASHKLVETTANFFALLPASVLLAMRKEGKAVPASWVEQDASERKYGPYAAYFVGNELTVEPFADYPQFVAGFEHMRHQE